MVNPVVSIVANMKVKGNSITDNKHLDHVLTEIATGKYNEKVEKIRHLVKEGKTDEAGNLKDTLPAFIATGKYIGGHKEENLSEFSNVIVLDFDEIKSELYDQIFIKACQISTTLACFKSPSGNGLKILVPISVGTECFECLFNQVAEFYAKELEIPFDRKCRNISRLCFYSYDPNLYKNLDCDIFQINQCPELIEIENQTPTESDLTKDEVQINFNKAEIHTKRIITFKEGFRNNFVFILACNCCRSSIPLVEAQNLILSKYGYDKEGIKSTISSAYKNETSKKTNLQKKSLFSLNLLNIRRYKAEIELDKRVMFEAFLIKMFAFNGTFYLTMKMIQQELGIKRARAKIIIDWFIEITFITKRKVTYQHENEPRQRTFYEVIPEKIVEVSKLMFIDNTEFVRRISPLLVGFLNSREKNQ